jgi:protein-tyrosine phosphatase
MSISRSRLSNLQRVQEGQTLPEEPSTLKKALPVEKVNRVSRCLAGDLAKGLAKSKFTTIPFIFGGLAVGGLFVLALFVFHFTPPAWMIAATALGGYAVGFFVHMLFPKSAQKLSFEFVALLRLKNDMNYSEIFDLNGKKLLLGALPNRLKSEGERLVAKEGLGAVLSLNEDFEDKSLGLSLPYEQDGWTDLGVHRKRMNVRDHTLLSVQQLDEAGDFIHSQIQKHTTLVHCRAGNGRSAMAVAAYLMKYQNCSAEEARYQIETHRKSSTIAKKLERLKEYERHLKKRRS